MYRRFGENGNRLLTQIIPGTIKRIHEFVLQPANAVHEHQDGWSFFSSPLDGAPGSSVRLLDSSAQIITVLSVLLVFFALVHGAVSGARESRGVTGGLQMVKQLVSWGEFFVTGHTVEVCLPLELDWRRDILNTEAWIHLFPPPQFLETCSLIIHEK